MNDYKMNFYVDHINRNVLNRINYARLQEDYQTEEKAYAKSVLNALHQGVMEVYGTETFDRDTLEEGFVLLPGVLQSRESGNVCIALLELDLSSSGERWGTDYLTKYGCINLREEEMPDAVRQFLKETYGTYDYGYTATLTDDIHVDKERLPDALKEILADFGNHVFVPCSREEVSENLLDYMADGDMERQVAMAGWKTRAEVAAIRKRYPAGSRIELDYMNEQGMPPGLKGIVKSVDDAGQLHMIWENGRSLALVPGADRFHRRPEPQAEKETGKETEAEEMER